MRTLFVHDTFYTLLCVIESVENSGPRGAIIRVKYGDRTYTIYAHVEIEYISVCPNHEKLYMFMVNILRRIHKSPYLNIVELQGELGQKGLFCSLMCLETLQKWRRSI